MKHETLNAPADWIPSGGIAGKSSSILEMALPFDPSSYFRVYLLDDDPSFCMLAASFFKVRKVDLFTCASVNELQLKIRAEKPDLVVLDYDLGENLTGADVARSLGDVPVMLVSANPDWLPECSGNIKGIFDKKYGISQMLNEVMEIAESTGKGQKLA